MFQTRLKQCVAKLQNIIIATLILRLFLAFEFGASGIEKIQSIEANSTQYFSSMQHVFANVWTNGNPYPFMINFLTGFAAPNAANIVTLIAAAELLIGIFYLFGFLVRPASIVGMSLNVIFYLAAGFTSVSTAGINVIMFGGQLYLFLVSAGRAYGIDAILSKKFHKL